MCIRDRCVCVCACVRVRVCVCVQTSLAAAVNSNFYSKYCTSSHWVIWAQWSNLQCWLFSSNCINLTLSWAAAKVSGLYHDIIPGMDSTEMTFSKLRDQADQVQPWNSSTVTGLCMCHSAYSLEYYHWFIHAWCMMVLTWNQVNCAKVSLLTVTMHFSDCKQPHSKC